jgi:pantoate--beta-alanine ligase
MPKLVTTINELRQELSHQRDRHIALIPTMGALHEGHLSLIEKCRLNSPDAFIGKFKVV